MVEGLLQILVVSFPTLLRRPVLHVLRDAHPIVGTLLLDQPKEILVLVGVPWSTMSGRACHYRSEYVERLCLKATDDSNKPPMTTRRHRDGILKSLNAAGENLRLSGGAISRVSKCR